MGNRPFTKNDYTLPEPLATYRRIETAPKTDWRARFIWDENDPGEENVWMRLRKTVSLDAVPEGLTAFISADSRYWLYINGELVVFEGSLKRGPTREGSYYDTVALSRFLRPGKNVIAALVWYWGGETSFSNTGSGKAGFLFEAGEMISDKSWRVSRHPAYKNDPGKKQPNYRLPESNIYYDARRDPGDWTAPDFDDGGWAAATEEGEGGGAPWGTLYPRGIPLFKDCGRKDYENSADFTGRRFIKRETITLDIPYNAQITPYIKLDAPAGRTVPTATENTSLGSVRDTYITKTGVQEFEALGWFNGEHISYVIPAGATVLALKYRETGYDAAFAGSFTCENADLNVLWQKSLRTLYVTMRDNFMDCPDRERAQWWGDVTNESAMALYCLDPDGWLLYQKGVACMLGHIDPETKVLETVVPNHNGFFELPAQQLAGVCGFWTYYLYTGDRDFLSSVYRPALDYLNLWEIGDDDLVLHRPGSWDWMDWGILADAPALENAWVHYAYSCLKKMAEALGEDGGEIDEKLRRIEKGYAAFVTKRGVKSPKAVKPDDRANAVALLSGLVPPEARAGALSVLTKTKNSSPYMEYYVLTALCEAGRPDLAKARMLRRYGPMIKKDYSTLWEHWVRLAGTLNHAWSGGPLVVMSKYFAGLRPTKPGWEEFDVRPGTDVCEKLDCTVPTVRGYIRLRVEKTDGGTAATHTVPKGATARIYLPVKAGQTVFLDGEPVKADGALTVRAEKEKEKTVRLTVG